MFSVKDIAEYIVALIAAFASYYQMTEVEAYRYLSSHGAIKVAHDFYDVMHTQSSTTARRRTSIVLICGSHGPTKISDAVSTFLPIVSKLGAWLNSRHSPRADRP